MHLKYILLIMIVFLVASSSQLYAKEQNSFEVTLRDSSKSYEEKKQAYFEMLKKDNQNLEEALKNPQVKAQLEGQFNMILGFASMGQTFDKQKKETDDNAKTQSANTSVKGAIEQQLSFEQERIEKGQLELAKQQKKN